MASFQSRRFRDFFATSADRARNSRRRRQSSPALSSEQLENRRVMAGDSSDTASFTYPPPV